MKTSNGIVIHFPAYAGGKFIGNCLSLSKHCMVLNKSSISYLLSAPDDYDYRLQQALSTLPDQTDMKRWVTNYEFGDREMYGSATTSWHNGEEGYIDKEIIELVESKSKFFMTAHCLQHVVNILKIWRNATVLTMINYREFRCIAARKKGAVLPDIGNECIEKYCIIKGGHWPTWERFQQVGYDANKLIGDIPDKIRDEIEEFYPVMSNKRVVFDMDDCIFEEDTFLASIEQLYQDLGFDDYNEKLISVYWNRYIALHR